MRNQTIGKKLMLGALLPGALAYAATFGMLVETKEAEASSREIPSSTCHAGTDDVGASLQNSGVLTYTGAATKSIFCPMVSDDTVLRSASAVVDVYGFEGTDGSISRTCSCELDPTTCVCSAGRSWANNAGGTPGRVASGISPSVWANNRGIEFGYILHTLTANSSLAGQIVSGP